MTPKHSGCRFIASLREIAGAGNPAAGDRRRPARARRRYSQDCSLFAFVSQTLFSLVLSARPMAASALVFLCLRDVQEALVGPCAGHQLAQRRPRARITGWRCATERTPAQHNFTGEFESFVLEHITCQRLARWQLAEVGAIVDTSQARCYEHAPLPVEVVQRLASLALVLGCDFLDGLRCTPGMNISSTFPLFQCSLQKRISRLEVGIYCCHLPLSLSGLGCRLFGVCRKRWGQQATQENAAEAIRQAATLCCQVSGYLQL
jgi:hypothetical protein